MKGYFKPLLLTVLLSAAAGVFVMTGCSEVDDTLGLGLVPGDQKMVVMSETLDGIDVFQTKPDSVPTENLGVIILGSMETDLGVTSASGIYQFFPLESPDERGDTYFTEGSKAFDAYIALYIAQISGDTEVEQTFYVYPLKDTMRYDTSYYPNYDLLPDAPNGFDSKVDMSQGPLFEFKMKDESSGIVYKKVWEALEGDDMQDGPDGEYVEYNGAGATDMYKRGRKYLWNMINLPQEVWSDDNEGKGLFHDNFPGFYIVRAADVPGSGVDEPKDAAIYDIQMSSSVYMQDLSFLMLRTLNEKDGSSPVEYDTVQTQFYFDETGYTIDGTNAVNPNLSNLSLAMLHHDYTGSLLDGVSFTDTIPGTSAALDEFYVQNMVGASGYLHFGPDFQAQLRALLTVDGTEYNSVYINKAWLRLPMKDNVSDPGYADAVKLAPSRLGLYLDYKSYYPTSIPDYPYVEELNSSGKSTFWGYLNNSQGCYEMDISTYVRQLLVNPAGTRDRIWLAPAWGGNAYSLFREVALQNDEGGREIELVLTYTLIK